MIDVCPYCDMDSAGNHDPDCPYRVTFEGFIRNPGIPIVMSQGEELTVERIDNGIEDLTSAINNLAAAIEEANKLARDTKAVQEARAKASWARWGIQIGKLDEYGNKEDF